MHTQHQHSIKGKCDDHSRAGNKNDQYRNEAHDGYKKKEGKKMEGECVVFFFPMINDDLNEDAAQAREHGGFG